MLTQKAAVVSNIEKKAKKINEKDRKKQMHDSVCFLLYIFVKVDLRE